MDTKTFDIINRISEEHCHKVFGYLDENDLKNEIWAICLEKLADFNYERGELEHFLRVSVKNRLVNRFKDITKSVRPPCPRCPFFDKKKKLTDCTSCLKYGEDGDNRNECNKWRNYNLSTESRNSLLNASEPKQERSVSQENLNSLIGGELKKLIKDNIDKPYLHDFQQLTSGGKISKQKLKKLKKEMNRILDSSEMEKLGRTKDANSKKR